MNSLASKLVSTKSDIRDHILACFRDGTSLNLKDTKTNGDIFCAYREVYREILVETKASGSEAELFELLDFGTSNNLSFAFSKIS